MTIPGTPGPKPLPPRFELNDWSATKPAKILWDPPEDPSPYLHRWWGTRYLIATETCTAIIAQMTPLELLIAQGRIDGLPDTEIADRMQLSPNAITQHMTRLRRRIWHQLPDLRPLLAGRRYQSPQP